MGNMLMAFSRVNQVGSRNDDDFADRMSHRYTAILLVVFSILVTGKQYTGDPIHCWCPNEWVDWQVDYANSLCWVKNTYYVPVGDSIPMDDLKRRRLEIGYYQWIPIVLLVQSCFFFLPSIVWRVINTESGININKIVRIFSETDCMNPEVRDKTVTYLVRHLDRCFDSGHDRKGGCCVKLKYSLTQKLCCTRRDGNVLVCLYLFIKLLYIGNAAGQVALLNVFLASNYTFYGVEVVETLLHGTGEMTTKRFPTVTLCDFKIRVFGRNTHRHTLQCVLPINVFNEKMYIFLWFWLLLVAVASIYTLFQWLMVICLGNRTRYIKMHLRCIGRYDKKSDKELIKKFTNGYLRQDGVFILRLLSKNINDVIVSELINGLWSHYKNFREKRSDMV
ncbi:unnamed protein product [Owenia fusiformis]|uniref:Innexin n=1 Tax=Owenia fusiformis TaxID=6347 RepID=A0A8J1XP67_OWEFU|nr:unnamed protein product [Owenia fusiformis]